MISTWQQAEGQGFFLDDHMPIRGRGLSLAYKSRLRIFFMALIVLATTSAPIKLSAKEKTAFTFTYLMRADDPYYAPHRAYTGLTLRERKRPVGGIEVALRESRALGRRLDLRFELEEIALGRDESAVDAIEQRVRQGQGVFILDLPLAEMRTTVERTARLDTILFDIRHPDTELRRRFCFDRLFYTLASRAMVADALAQYLRKKGWLDVLMLVGPEDADQADATAFRAAAAKFGLSIVATRDFVLSNDPRNRERTNIALMTGEPDHDVVYLADNRGEFGRYVPYATHLARPVVGSEGLIASGWHWTWERHGAPQLNQRFDKRAGRQMVAEDWAAWAAVKSVVEAISRTGSTDLKALRDFLVADEFNLDTYKGVPGSFRPWNRQLRQPLLLHTHNAVIERAPLDQFLHASHHLDTLGLDRSESECSPEPHR